MTPKVAFFDKMSYCISDLEGGCCPQPVIYSWKRCCFGQLSDRGLGISQQLRFSPPIGSRLSGLTRQLFFLYKRCLTFKEEIEK